MFEIETNVPMQANIETLLWRVYREAEGLLRDLERVETADHTVLDLAGAFIHVLNTHIEPLRRVVEDVEFHERADAALNDYFGPL